MEQRPIPGFEPYVADDQGNISRPRMKRVSGAPRALSAMSNHGYLRVNLSLGHRRTSCQLVHRLVCMAFHGPPPFDGAQVNHKDGNRQNNRPSNLEWVSPQTNSQHAKHTLRRGSVKLTPESVVALRTEYAAGKVTQSELARRHGVAQAHISLILRGVQWADVGGPRTATGRGSGLRRDALDPRTADAIRRDRQAGMTQQALAAKYSTSQSVVSRLLLGRTYRA